MKICIYIPTIPEHICNIFKIIDNIEDYIEKIRQIHNPVIPGTVYTHVPHRDIYPDDEFFVAVY